MDWFSFERLTSQLSYLAIVSRKGQEKILDERGLFP